MTKNIKGARITFEVTDDGSLKLVEKGAKKTKRSFDSLGDSAHTADRRLKGASQQSSNTTKNFSKMAQGITGGLVPAYATLAANIFAISAVFRFLSDAADFRVMLQGQQEFAAQTGTSLSLLTAEVQAATDAQLAFKEASQAVAIGRAAGLTKDQIIDLAEVAKNASLALGRDLTDSFQRLTRGAIKAEPELLDELGIIVRLNDATKEYARLLDLDANALNTFQKSQAVVNATIAQGQEKFGDLNIEVNSFTKLAKTFDDVLNTLKKGISDFAEFLATSLAVNPAALAGASTLLGTGLLKAMIPDTPTIDPRATMKGGLKDLKKFYTGKNLGKFMEADFGELQLKNLERSINATTSQVINSQNMTKAAMMQTVAKLRAANAVMVAEQATGFTKMRLKFIAELKIMQFEYGKFMGTLKFIGVQGMKALSAVLTGVGIAGALLSIFGIVRGIINQFKDPAVLEFEQTQSRIVTSAQRQAVELKKVVDKLKTQKNIVDQLIVQSRILANISFKNFAEGFGEVLDIERGTRGSTREGTREFFFQLTDPQRKILEGTITTLEAAKSVLGGEAAEEVAGFIKTLSKGLEEFADEGKLTETLADIIPTLVQLDEKGLGPNVEKASEVAKAITFAENAYKTFGQTLEKIKLPITPFANLRTSIREIADSFAIIAAGAPMLSDKEFAGGQIRGIIGDDLEGMLKNILGEVAATKALDEAQKKVNESANKRVEVSTQLEVLSNLLFGREKEILEVEMKRITAKTNLATATALELRFATNLQKKEIQTQQKIAQLNIQKEEILHKLRILTRDGKTLSKEQNAEFLAQLQNLEAQRLNIMMRLRDTARNAFETGATSTFASLIKGERPEGGRSAAFAKGIADALTNELATSMSKGLSDLLFTKKQDPAEKIQTAMVDAATFHAEAIKAAMEGKDIPAFAGGGSGVAGGGLFSGITSGIKNFLFGSRVEPGVSGGTRASYNNQRMDSIHATFGADTGNLFQRLFMSSDRFGDSFFKQLFGGNFGGAFSTFFGLAKGGIMSYGRGGIAKQPTYMVGEGKQHEAVVPLPDNKSIPVNLKGANANNNVNVSVNMETGATTMDSSDDGFVLGQAISAAVIKEIERQQRPGGQLSTF
jgi:hypothetical protein